jgi:hypothetical protein
MSINYVAILQDLATWASAAKVALGAVAHKVGSWLYAKWQAAEADAKKLAADAEAAAKKL